MGRTCSERSSHDYLRLISAEGQLAYAQNTGTELAEQAFGPPISDPDLVEDVIRRAQLAVLNPTVDMARFVDYVIPEVPEAFPLGSREHFGFSFCVVVLEITGPEVTDLTIVDLPGIIQNVGAGEDDTSIGMIEAMVMRYIEKECLILLVLTMKGEPLQYTAYL
jgi:hypothetical protein